MDPGADDFGVPTRTSPSDRRRNVRSGAANSKGLTGAERLPSAKPDNEQQPDPSTMHLLLPPPFLLVLPSVRTKKSETAPSLLPIRWEGAARVRAGVIGQKPNS